MEDPLAPLLLGLQRLPAQAHSARARGIGAAEDMRMPANELLAYAARDGLEIASSLLLEEQRQKVHLEEEIAKLPLERNAVVGKRRVGDLVRLLERVRDDRDRRLLAIPGALPAQLPGQVLEVEERLREAHGPIIGP